ncbi:hypothetical protein [Dermatophilus congolensis]|uniref:DUF218 domain n=1 Tax=Dermatophilus congolensis TaxID=1863 RepID=A0A239V6R6_9MICO|nr:hypothetical protein [Dermatophilus congolensis]MBO3130386.1 hypothetical protein [Dermatophilus congolensis]MBO3130983.1 hypothetical protein [Dermatophilus congolensis]MBO3134857.1 hypothetical protein [Dermatophilus congolensis]MBO3137094.1 hypothetical protein [Dermatophilus congolensis]MBO3139338.1 hypothetical protein [Dermatophilus congolensis]
MPPRLRIKRIIAAAVAAALALIVAVPAGLVFFPVADEPATSDAILVVGPPFPGRVALADKLMREGKARTLVVATFAGQERRQGVTICNQKQPYPVECFVPSPYTTRGEAQNFSQMAQRNNWHSVQVITFWPHANRVRTLVNRCFDGKVDVLVAQDRVGAHEVLHHMGGWAKMLTYWSC